MMKVVFFCSSLNFSPSSFSCSPDAQNFCSDLGSALGLFPVYLIFSQKLTSSSHGPHGKWSHGEEPHGDEPCGEGSHG